MTADMLTLVAVAVVVAAVAVSASLVVSFVYATVIEIPTYGPDYAAGYGYKINGTKMFDYDAAAAERNGNITTIPYKNGTISLDLTAYPECVKEANARIIAGANLEGTNVPQNRENLRNMMLNEIGSCSVLSSR